MTDSYAPSRATTEGRVYNLSGGDWERVLADPIGEQRIVLNMGPQHPSTHGVLRLIVELEGETVTDMRTVIGYLHTGIEKNTEYRTWTQAVTFLTRADYLAPLFNETAYCLAVEKLLGVTVPPRGQLIRLLVMEINRVSSHWVALATGGMEMGALTAMTNGLRARERCLDMLEMITGLRMNHAYIRPGGIAQDLPDDAVPRLRDWVVEIRKEINGLRTLVQNQPIWVNRLRDVGWLGVEGCLSLGVTGPMLRAAGLPWDLRKTEPYLGYETFDFEVPVQDGGDCYARFLVRLDEMYESTTHRRAGARAARARAGVGRRPEDRLAREALVWTGRHGQLARARAEDHERVDGVADPPLQAGHRGLPRPAGPGLRRDRGAARRAGRARGQ